MSLMLRKSCQEILNKNGLSMFHVDISSEKKLAVVSDCGKPIFTINGISFSKATPSNAEIEFATELLSGYLIKHKTNINNYLSLLTDLADFSDISYELKDMTFYSSTSYSRTLNKNVRTNSVTFFEGSFLIKVNEFGYLMRFELSSIAAGEENKTTLTIPDLKTSPFYKEAMEHMDLCVKHITVSDALDAALYKLNSCDI